MAYVKAPIPSEVYHLTTKEHLPDILDDGQIRRFGDSECWSCETPEKLRRYMEQTVLCEGKPYYAVDGSVQRYPKFKPEDHVILKLTPCRREGNGIGGIRRFQETARRSWSKLPKNFPNSRSAIAEICAFRMPMHWMLRHFCRDS